jgi:imidazolonepropionase
MKVDLLLHSAAQLVTCASADGRPKRGAAMRDVGIIHDGAVAVADGAIVAVGGSADLRAAYQATATLDASGQVVCPGFVDCHTHVVYAGDRVGEFEARIRGATYLEILAAGGGILSTMQAVRAATIEQLVAESAARLDAMLALGTTTVEAKTGYGLNFHNELKTLVVTGFLDRSHPIDLVPTFLGAHAVPPEYAGNTNGYAWWVAEEMIPAVATWYADSHFTRQACALLRGCLLRAQRLRRGAVAARPGRGQGSAGWPSRPTWTSSPRWAGWNWRWNWARSASIIWT